jgi:hypothetical protein
MSDYGIDAENVDALDAAMLELYGAMDNDLRMLAAIGIRTTYDIASELLGIDPTLTFEKKLDALVCSGRISIVDKDRLEMMVDAGSASAHRGWRANPSTMMDVLEHFVHDSFVAPASQETQCRRSQGQENCPAAGEEEALIRRVVTDSSQPVTI